MARNLKDWTTAYSPATDDYPTGSAKDASSSEATDGTPYVKEILNGLIGVQQAILRNAGFDLEQDISHKPENVNESDILRALLKIIGRDAGSLVSSEKTERQNADNNLQSNINNEAQARQNADNVLQNNINNEAQERRIHGLKVGDLVTTLNIHRYDGVWLPCYGQKILASDFPDLYEDCCGGDNYNGLKTVWEDRKEFIVLPDINDRVLVCFYPWMSLGDYFDEQLPNITGCFQIDKDAKKNIGGAFNYTDDSYENWGNSDNKSSGVVTFDASRCSSAFGRRDKFGNEAVRMRSFSGMLFIKVR